jgi:GDSL-like Lipase/Acylhydrolase family
MSVLAGKATRIRRLISGALSILFGVTLAFGVAELGLRVVVPNPRVYRALAPNLEVTLNAQDHAKGVQGPALFKVNSMGVRGREWSGNRASEYRVLCLGGSTTESLLNDQGRIWTTLLEHKLNPMADGRDTWVGNIGKAGLGSEHHIVQLKHLGVYDPNLIVALVGSSDFMSYLKQGDDSDSRDAVERERRLEDEAFALVPGRPLLDPLGNWYKRTRLWGLGSELTQFVFHKSDFQDRGGLSLKRWRDMRAAGKRSDTMPNMEAALAAYERNVKEMVKLAGNLGAPILLMTQPSIWRAGLSDLEKAQLWMGGVGDSRDVPGSLYYEPEALERGMDAYNQRLLEVCRETGTPCLDLAKAVPKSADNFYDDEHFTDKGQELVANRVAEAIRLLLHNGNDRATGF